MTGKMNMEAEKPTSAQLPIPIVGTGCITAAGRTVDENLATMFRGTRAPSPPSRIETDHKIAYPVFEVPDAWMADQITNPGNRQRCADFALIAAREALAQAGLADAVQRRKLRIGVCLGTVVGAAMEETSFYELYHHGKCPEIEPVLEFLKSNPAKLICERLELTGPYMTVTTACTSGASAICQAAAWIQNDLCDAVIAGGTEKLSRLSYNGFISLMITDAEACRPFDRQRSGLNLGEGAGVVVLESPHSAARRQARPRGVLLGAGNACDAYHLSRPDPAGSGLRKAVRDAMTGAGLVKSNIDFINAHGTGTPDNDYMEGRLFCEWFPGIPFHSTKCYTGHTLGAAGGIEAVLAVECLNRKRIPGNAGFTTMDPDIGGTPVATCTAVPGATALSTSVAYGGNNIALFLGGASSYLSASPVSSDVPRRLSRNNIESITIEGLGVVGGFGAGRKNLWSALQAPATFAQPPAKVQVRTAGGDREFPAFLCDTDPLREFVPKKKLRRVDHFSRLTALGIALALEDAGLMQEDDLRHVGVIMATGYGANETTFRFLSGCIEYGDAGASPLLFSGSGHSGALSSTTILLNITGPLLTICQPQLAAVAALETAVSWLRNGVVDHVVVGAVEEYFPLRGYVEQAVNTEAPAGRIMPFELEQKTAVMGEEAAFLVLSYNRDGDTTERRLSVAWGSLATGLPELPSGECVLIGADGNPCRASGWSQLMNSASQVRWYSCTPVFGSLPANLPMHVAVATLMRDKGVTALAPDFAAPGTVSNGNPDAVAIRCLEMTGNGRYGLVRVT